MKIPTKINLKTVAVIVCLSILLTSGFFYAIAQTPSSTFVITGGVYPNAVAYTIWREGSNYFAKDANGQLQYSGTNASNIITNCLGIGDSIFFRSGTYLLDSTILVTQAYITIKGESCGSSGTVLKLADNADCNMFNLSGATFFRLENMELQGNSANNALGTGVWSGYSGALVPTADITLNHVFIHAFQDYGVYLHDCWGTVIIDCYIEGNQKSGARLIAWNYLVQSSTFNWNEEYGLELSGDGGGLTIENNAICENKQHGILVGSGHDMIISGNLIRGNGAVANDTWDGIRVNPANENLTIANNVIDGRGFKNYGDYIISKYGIRCDSDETVITGNTIIHCGTDEIAIVSGVILEANYGYPSENSGSVSLATGATVTHGLAETPTSVTVTAGVTGLSNIYVDTLTTTTFKINFAGGGSQTFYWYAEYKP